jgi:hypothetical protein
LIFSLNDTWYVFLIFRFNFRIPESLFPYVLFGSFKGGRLRGKRKVGKREIPPLVWKLKKKLIGFYLLQSRRILRYLPIISFSRLPPAKFIFLIYPFLLTWQTKSQVFCWRGSELCWRGSWLLSATSAKRG